MKSFTAIVALALVACASAGILSPYVGGYYGGYGYYGAPVVASRVIAAPVARVAIAAPVARVVAPAPIVAPAIGYSSYYAAPYAAPYAAYASPYAAYSYLLKKK